VPIVINGSGSISGVSTGGLPDGIVDADMLATSAVTSAKILDATIASGDLASGVGGKVVQVKRIYLEATTSTASLSYSTSGGLNGTLDSNGIYRLKDSDGDYLTIPNFSATSGNMLIAWVSYPGFGSPASACNYSLGIEWGSASLRTYVRQGYNGQNYTQGHSFTPSTVLSSNLSSVNIHAILRFEETGKTIRFDFSNTGNSATNWGTEGASAQTVDCSLIVMEIEV